MKTPKMDCNWKHIVFIAISQLKCLLMYPNNVLYWKICLRYNKKGQQKYVFFFSFIYTFCLPSMYHVYFWSPFTFHLNPLVCDQILAGCLLFLQTDKHFQLLWGSLAIGTEGLFACSLLDTFFWGQLKVVRSCLYLSPPLQKENH